MSTHEAQPHGHTLPLSKTRGAVIQLVVALYIEQKSEDIGPKTWMGFVC